MSIKSMTAFGFGETSTGEYQYRCEMKTLNTRFIDTFIKLPRSLNSLESLTTLEIKKTLKRGKVDVHFNVVALDVAAKLPRLNLKACEHYANISSNLAGAVPFEIKPLTTFELLRLEGVLDSHTDAKQSDPVTFHKEGVLGSLRQALTMVQEARSTEGEALRPALTSLIGQVTENREKIQSQSQNLQDSLYNHYVSRLQSFMARIGETGEGLPPSISEDRILSEVTILADKCDIAEELTRLAAHESEFLKTIETGGEVGRKLDFLCQELHREVNTISSKVSQLDVVSHTLAMKQAIERLRQQVQNIE